MYFFGIDIKDLFFETLIGKILQVAPVMILSGLVYVLLFLCYRSKKKERINVLPVFIKFVFICYFSGIIALILTPPSFWSAIWFWLFYGHFYIELSLEKMLSLSFNFIPSVYYYLIGELTGGSWIKTMIVGNILMFVPMGMLLPIVLRKNGFFEVARFSAISILVIETIQPFIGRSFDVDDIIYNAVGVAVGFLCYLIVNKIFPAFISKCRAN